MRTTIKHTDLVRIIRAMVGGALIAFAAIIIIAGALFYLRSQQIITGEKDILDECQEGSISEKKECFAGKFVEFAEKKGFREALLAITRAKNVRPDLYTNCHFIGHSIGKAAYDHFGNFPETLAAADGVERNICTTGYYHHVLIEYVGQNSDALEESGLALAKGSCGVIAADPKKKQFVTECYHGLGHGLAAVFDYNLQRALGQCDSLIYENDQLACYSGVFMQNAMLTSESDDADSSAINFLFFKKDDPFYPCRKVGGKYRNACYFNAMQQYFDINKEPTNQSRSFYDIASGAFALCRQVPEENRPHCFGGIAVNGAYIVGWDAKTVREICLRGESSDAEKFCIIGAASRWAKVGIERAFAFCAIVPAEYIDICRQSVMNPVL